MVSVPTGRNVLSDFKTTGLTMKSLFQFLPAGMSFQTGQKGDKEMKMVSVPTGRNVLSDDST